MEYLEFVACIRDQIEEKMPGHTITMRQVLKNNGLKLQGLTISDDLSSAAPTIYMEHYYEQYLSGTTVEEICNSVMSVYEENRLENDFDLDFLMDYEKVRPHLFLKAINREKNAEMLRDVPYRAFLDLALVPYVRIVHSGLNSACTVVHANMLDYWHVSGDRIVTDAMSNMQNTYGYKLMPIREVLAEMLDGCDAEDFGKTAMYVLLSPGMQYSAALMAVEPVMRFVGEQLQSDFVVLPSSIHEVIILPSQESKDMVALRELVCSVNETTVSAEEVLSDHAYFYKRGQGYVSA